MALTITINGTVTLDESPGLQPTDPEAVPLPDGDPQPDNDVSLAALPAAFSTRLFDAGQLALSNVFATANGVAQSASNFISVSGGSVTSLGFVDGSGAALPTYTGDPTTGVLSPVNALDGGEVRLFKDASLGDRMVLGVDTDGDVVFALFLDPVAALTSAGVWMVQFESIHNPLIGANNPDDPVNLFDSLGVAAGQNLEFAFDTLPAGQNLFGVVGDTDTALVVIGKTPVLNANGTFTNTSNTINTSQGGGAVTIGINNQMFDPGEGAYFTLVQDPDARYLSGVTNGLDQNEADDADNILYAGGTLEVTSTFTKISQIQGNSLATMKVTAIDMSGSPQGQDFVRTNDNPGPSDGLGVGTVRTITEVEVFNAVGALIGTWDENGDAVVSGVDVLFNANGSVDVSGLNSGYKVQWTTNGVHDQVLIEGVVGKFDIGAFGADQPQPTPDQVLDFTVQATDSDGDTQQDSFRVGIDGTGIYDDGVVDTVEPLGISNLAVMDLA